MDPIITSGSTSLPTRAKEHLKYGPTDLSCSATYCKCTLVTKIRIRCASIRTSNAHQMHIDPHSKCTSDAQGIRQAKMRIFDAHLVRIFKHHFLGILRCAFWLPGYLCTECPKSYRKSVLNLYKYRFADYLSRCSKDLR